MAFDFTLSASRVVIDGTLKTIGTLSGYEAGATEFALSGTDAANFEIDGGTLKIKSAATAGKYSIVINGTSPMDSGTLTVNIYAFPSGSVLIDPVNVAFDSSLPAGSTGIQAAAWSSTGLLLYLDGTANGDGQPPTPGSWHVCYSIPPESNTENVSTMTSANANLSLNTVTSCADSSLQGHTLADGDIIHVYGEYMGTIVVDQSLTLPELSAPEPDLTPITGFTATASSTSSIVCSFTLPAGLSDDATIEWQYTTVDPTSAEFDPDTDWITLATTDTNGNVATE